MFTVLIIYVSVIVGLAIGATVADMLDSKKRAKQEFDVYWKALKDEERVQGLQTCWRMELKRQPGESDSDFISRGRLAAFLASTRFKAADKK